MFISYQNCINSAIPSLISVEFCFHQWWIHSEETLLNKRSERGNFDADYYSYLSDGYRTQREILARKRYRKLVSRSERSISRSRDHLGLMIGTQTQTHFFLRRSKITPLVVSIRQRIINTSLEKIDAFQMVAVHRLPLNRNYRSNFDYNLIYIMSDFSYNYCGYLFGNDHIMSSLISAQEYVVNEYIHKGQLIGQSDVVQRSLGKKSTRS